MNITLQQIEAARANLEGVIVKTPLQLSKRLSQMYGATVYLKREDLQEVRSFKIRGAYNKIQSLTEQERKRGIVTASTGNHAQGVALSCYLLKIHGVIFMPIITPLQKIEKVKHFGDGYVQIKLIGNTFDDAVNASKKYCEEKNASYVHPFDDPYTIAGQGTIGLEIYEDLSDSVDVVVSPVGGGGIAAGISSFFKQKNPKTKIYGVEASGAASMEKSIKEGKIVPLGTFDIFVDGAAVNTVGDLTYQICKKNLEKVIVVPVGLVCTVMISLYQNEGIIAEPAGALSVAALDYIEDIKGKTVVCIISGGNNDILRYPEIMEKSLVYQGLKHYFLLEFAQKPGQLKKFLDKALGPTDDIVRFEYIKKTNKDRGAALVGVELKDKNDLGPLTAKMKEIGLNFRILSTDDLLYSYLV